MKNEKTLHQKLLDIVQDDFDSCEWFIISANELMKTLNDTIEMLKDENTPVEKIKDLIGEIGVGIGNVERCLDGVEDCYNKTVELLSNTIGGKKE